MPENKLQEYRGEIAIASVLDILDDPQFKIRARVLTGHFEGEECYIEHRGKPNKSGNIIFRIGHRDRTTSQIPLDSTTPRGFFIRSGIPKYFDFAPSEDVILYGVWSNFMKQGYDIPSLGRIVPFYSPGPMMKAIYFASGERGFAVPYELNYGVEPMRWIMHDGTEKELSPRNALTGYLKAHRKAESTTFPRVVIVDKKLKKLGLEELTYEINATDMIRIRMEAQQ